VKTTKKLLYFLKRLKKLYLSLELANTCIVLPSDGRAAGIE
jgi:hypothetical protein|tara:strand:- start:205 stop:327 length:123 start_codon:yes stop_codon:yes gene_type:complete